MKPIDYLYGNILHKILSDESKGENPLYHEYTDPSRNSHQFYELLSDQIVEHYHPMITEPYPVSLISSKKVYYKLALDELDKFITGKTAIGELPSIWHKDAYNYFKRLKEADRLPNYDFIDSINSPEDLARQWPGFELGNIYPKYMSNVFEEAVEYLQNRNDSPSRRALWNWWRPEEQGPLECALPPCHYQMEILLKSDNQFILTFSMRSCDVFLGLPFNLMYYSTLAQILSLISGKKCLGIQARLSHVHVYGAHLEVAKEQLSRIDAAHKSITPDLEYPAGLSFSPEFKQWAAGFGTYTSLEDMPSLRSNISINNYIPMGPLKGEMIAKHETNF